MSYTLRAAVLVGIVAIFSGRAAAQGVVMQRTISLNMAKIIAEATLAECKSKGYNTAVAVVDRAGQVLVMVRDESRRRQSGRAAEIKRSELTSIARGYGFHPRRRTAPALF